MDAITVMSALAQPTRLDVLSHLAQAGEAGLTAGDLAGRTRTPANTMSSHLAILSRAGLTTSRRAGRNVIYSASPDAVRELADFLVRDFCRAPLDR